MRTERLLVFAFLCLLGCGGPGTPAEPEIPLRTLSLVDSVGVELGDSAYVFGAILGVEFHPLGGFAVLDRAAGNVRLYNDDGTLARTIGRPGSGPGEIVQAYGLLVWSNGDLGVLDPFQGGLMRFSPEGDYLGLAFEAFHNIPLNPRMAGDSCYVAVRTAMLEEGENLRMESFLGGFPLSWEPSVRYLSESTPLDPSTLANNLMRTFFYMPWAVDPASGTVYAAPYEEGLYRIRVFHRDGNQTGVWESPVIPAAKTPGEIAEERDYIAAFLTAAEGGDPQYNVLCDPYPFRHPVASMEVDDRGNLWVLRGDTEGVVFNVWSPSGQRMFDAALPGMSGGDLRFRVEGDRMLLYRENPQDYQRIYLIRIPR